MFYILHTVFIFFHLHCDCAVATFHDCLSHCDEECWSWMQWTSGFVRCVIPNTPPLPTLQLRHPNHIPTVLYIQQPADRSVLQCVVITVAGQSINLMLQMLSYCIHGTSSKISPWHLQSYEQVHPSNGHSYVYTTLHVHADRMDQQDVRVPRSYLCSLLFSLLSHDVCLLPHIRGCALFVISLMQ